MQLQPFSGPASDDVPVRDGQWCILRLVSLVQLASAANEPEEGGGGAQQDFGVSASVQLPLVASAVCSASSKLLLRYEPLKKSCEYFFSLKIPKNQKATTENLPLTLHFCKCNLINF